MNNRTKLWNMLAVLIAALIIAIALCERAGWPFLAAPLEKQLSSLLKRDISFDSKNSVNSVEKTAIKNGSVTHSPPEPQAFQIRFLGGLRLNTANLLIAKPTWSTKPYFLQVENLALKLRYIDVWRAYYGQPIHIKSLQAQKLEGYIERLADGRASWQFKDKPDDPDKPIKLPSFDELTLINGLLHVNDAPLKAKIEAKLSLENRTLENGHIDNQTVKQKKYAKLDTRLTATANGRYQDLPLKIDLVSIGALSGADTSAELPVALKLNASIGRAHLRFKGKTKDIMQLDYFVGSYTLKGTSLAAVGDLFGVTLPTTAAFNTNGNIEKQDLLWRVKVNHLLIGDSDLNGQFTYDRSPKTPSLKGKLGGKKLVITDLGPAFGATAKAKNTGKVLPTRPFDLASLRRMNADLLIDIQYLDLKTRILQPLKPLQGHLKLNNAVLTLNNIYASTADGLLKGDMRLDGRGNQALWDADLRWSGVRLERWIKQSREKGSPPYIAGKLHGSAKLKGQGKSTAAILASLSGDVRSELQDGAVSHLAIEVAGLDLAQSVGVIFKGDDALPVQCAIADLHAQKGTFTPKVLVVDTEDTTLWVTGSLSLATETLNLRAVALPKDFSPLTVRVPVNVTGPFAHPQVSLEKKPVGLKLAASALLALVNPLAAVIPLLDNGDTKLAKQRASRCASLMKKPT